MSSSGQYNSLSPKSDKLIREAYRPVTKVPSVLTDEQIESAQTSINLIFSSWYNEGWNIWTTKRKALAIYPGQSTYKLPIKTQNVTYCAIRNSDRKLSGTAFTSAGGNADLAFDGDMTTACTQTSPDGYISYEWGTRKAIQLVGIISNSHTDYTLNFEYCNDGVNWINVLSVSKQLYQKGILYWFNIESPCLGNQFRVRESGGATLDMIEIYFNVMTLDTTMTGLSGNEYDVLSDKSNQGQPSSYFFDRQIEPLINFYPSPNDSYTVYYKSIEAIQDIGELVDNPNIPSRFLLPLTQALSYMLAMKSDTVPLDKVMALKSIADESFLKASARDTENASLRISPSQGEFR